MTSFLSDYVVYGVYNKKASGWNNPLRSENWAASNGVVPLTYFPRLKSPLMTDMRKSGMDFLRYAKQFHQDDPTAPRSHTTRGEILFPQWHYYCLLRNENNTETKKRK